MDCPTVRDLSVAFLESELSPGEAEQVTDHIEHCDACADLLGRLASQETDLAGLPPPLDARLSAPGFWDRMDAALAVESERVLAPPAPRVSAWKRPLQISPVGMAAYATALLLALAWGWMKHLDASVSAARAVALESELEQERRLAAQPPAPIRVEQYRPVSYTPRRGTF